MHPQFGTTYRKFPLILSLVLYILYIQFIKQMLTSALTTLITVTATLIVPTHKVPTLVLVKKVGLKMGHRVQVPVCLQWSFWWSNTQAECFIKRVNFFHILCQSLDTFFTSSIIWVEKNIMKTRWGLHYRFLWIEYTSNNILVKAFYYENI